MATGKPRAPWPCGPCVSLTVPTLCTCLREARSSQGHPGPWSEDGAWQRGLGSATSVWRGHWGSLGGPRAGGDPAVPRTPAQVVGTEPSHGRPAGLPLASLSPGPAQGWWPLHGAGLGQWAPSHPPTARLGLLPAHTQGETPGPFVPSPCSAVAGAARRQGAARISQVRSLG